MSLAYLFENFFTHKDFLPPASELWGTMFTPLHFISAAFWLALVIFFGIYVGKRSEKTIKRVFLVLWIFLVVVEIVKMIWETCAGDGIKFEAGGVIPLYPCSIFMYAMPLVIWGKGILRRAGCGYVCTLGFLGGAINFIYPATVLGNYSALSFAGFQIFIYHGALVFCMMVMLISGYHSYKGVKTLGELFAPMIPFLVVSVFANIVNFSPVNSDYMFFKLNSFFFAPIGQALPAPVCVIITYLIYTVIHTVPYLPSYIANKRAEKLEIKE
jgi:hypothetical protein